MSDLDPTPPVPSCPICMARQQVQRENGRWLCGECWTVFTGEQGEWERSSDMRAVWQKLDVWRQRVLAAKEEQADA